jgi:prepilin-type N-terminal cleavage/methylation domain-containing protein
MFMRSPFLKRGFTLVELLVTIGIIGVLLALSIPAIQKLRELANRIQCASQLRQLGFALHLHHQDHGVLPSNGGWDGKQQIKDALGNFFTPSTLDYASGKKWNWGVGQPGLGPHEQTGSWIYAILPYLEKTAQYENVQWDSPYRLLHCPTRRKAMTWGASNDQYGEYQAGGLTWAKTDYAANGWVIPNRPRCLSFAEITDGLSNTILLGEKALNQFDADRETWYWDEPFFIGGSGGTQRFGVVVVSDSHARFPFQQDAWGAGHSGGINTLFGDNSVRQLSFRTKWSTVIGLLSPDNLDE